MRLRSAIITLVLGISTACSDHPLPMDVKSTDGLTTVAANRSFTDGRYPTESEAIAAGYSSGGIDATTPTGFFGGGNLSWSSSTTVSYSWVNAASATLNAKVTDDNGTTINSGAGSFSWSAWLPTVVTDSRSVNASLSTSNHTCGITGSARLTGSASFTVLNNALGVTQLWSGNVDKSATDVTLSACPTVSADSLVASGCPNQIIYDPSTCSSEGGGGGSGSGGGGSGGICQLWLVTISESYDGGDTWVVVEKYYYLVC